MLQVKIFEGDLCELRAGDVNVQAYINGKLRLSGKSFMKVYR